MSGPWEDYRGLAVDVTDDRRPGETDEQYRARMFAENLPDMEGESDPGGPLRVHVSADQYPEEESGKLGEVPYTHQGGDVFTQAGDDSGEPMPWDEYANPVDLRPQPEPDWMDALPPGGIAQTTARFGVGAAQGAAHVMDNAANILEGAWNQTGGRIFGQSNSADNPAFENLASNLGRGGEWGRTAGEVGASAFLTRGMGGPAMQGAGAGALMSDADTLGGGIVDTVLGAAGGKLGDAAVRGASRLIAPQVSNTARYLYDRKVRMTPGQVIPSLRRVEDRLTSRAFVGDKIVRGRQQSYEDFNTAGLGEVVAPYNAIKPAVPVMVPRTPGHGAVKAVGDQLSSRYNSLIPNLRFIPDEQLGADIGALDGVIRSGEMSPASLKQFEAIVRNHVMSRLPGFGKKAATPSTSRALVVQGTALGPAGAARRAAADATPGDGSISGEAYRQIEKNLGRQISRYRRSTEPDHQAMASAFEEMQDAFQAALHRSNPKYATELGALNTSWRNLVRVEGAASSARGGLFSPQQFRQAVRRGDDSTRRRGMARGEAPMQDFAEAGIDVLPPEYPDSGTAGRAQMSPFDPRYWLGAAQGLAYGPGAQQAITNTIMAPRPRFAQPVAKALESLPAPQLGAMAIQPYAEPIIGGIGLLGRRLFGQ